MIVMHALATVLIDDLHVSWAWIGCEILIFLLNRWIAQHDGALWRPRYVDCAQALAVLHATLRMESSVLLWLSWIIFVVGLVLREVSALMLDRQKRKSALPKETDLVVDAPHPHSLEARDDEHVMASLLKGISLADEEAAAREPAKAEEPAPLDRSPATALLWLAGCVVAWAAAFMFHDFRWLGGVLGCACLFVVWRGDYGKALAPLWSIVLASVTLGSYFMTM